MNKERKSLQQTPLRIIFTLDQFSTLSELMNLTTDQILMLPHKHLERIYETLQIPQTNVTLSRQPGQQGIYRKIDWSISRKNQATINASFP